jgi:plastocyanin
MGTPRGGKATRSRGRELVLLTAVASLLALAQPGAGQADGATIEPAERPSGFYWNPSTASVAPGGSVEFRNPGKVVPHGLAWTGGPEKPSCSGVPVDSSGTDWSGSCSFAQAGTYSFVCTVHPEMQGSVTVAAAGTTPGPGPAPAPGPSAEGPLNGEPSQALRLLRSQNGSSVRGSLDLTAAAAGGKLRIELRARAGALGTGGRGTLRVGRLVRSSLSAGRRSFAVPLKPAARRALRERKRLPIAVEIVVSPPEGSAVKLRTRVVAHA